MLSYDVVVFNKRGYVIGIHYYISNTLMFDKNRRTSNVQISIFVYVISIHLYVRNTFSALPNLSVFSTCDKGGKNLPIPTFLGARSENQRISVKTRCVDQFSLLGETYIKSNMATSNVKINSNIWQHICLPT